MVSRMFCKGALLTVLGFFLLGTMTALAENGCERRIRNAEMHLQQAVQRHGQHSRQAETRRHELERARQSCHR